MSFVLIVLPLYLVLCIQNSIVFCLLFLLYCVICDRYLEREPNFVIAEFVSTYFTVILPGFQMLLVIKGLPYSGVRYSGVPL